MLSPLGSGFVLYSAITYSYFNYYRCFNLFRQFGLHFLPSLFHRVQPPRKRPKVEKKGFKEDPFVFLKDDDEHWPLIK